MSSERFDTHEVLNQPPPLEPYDAFASDAPLREALAREAGGVPESTIAAYGRLVGGEMMALGVEANRHPPRLDTHDRYGHRIDRISYHPSWHRLMELGVEHGVAAFAWRDPAPGAHVARAALSFLHHQAEAGSSCPLTMSYAAVPVVRQLGPAGEPWLHGLLSRHYDSNDAPAAGKRGLVFGMA